MHGIELRPDGLTAAETALAETLARDKYGSAEWTRAGRVVGVAPAPRLTLSPQGRGRGEGPGGAVTDAPREYPDAPRVGVGAVVLEGERVLLVQRGRPPSQGKWSLPGGLVHLGERLEDAVRREVTEECGLAVRVLDICGVIDRVVRDAAGGGDRVRYHWVIVDYVAEPTGGTLRAASDAADARWVPLSELGGYDTTDGLADMIHRAVAMERRRSR